MKRNVILLGLGVLLALPLAFLWRAQHGDVVYVPSPPEVVDAMLALANLQSGDVVYDLGCGDARILVAAAERFGVQGYGVDLDPDCIRLARENIARAGVQRLVSVEEKDLFDVDQSEASVVMLFLGPKINERLVPKLKTLAPGRRIVSHDFDIPGYPPKEIRTVEVPGRRNHRVLLWIAPLAAAQ